MRALLRTIHTGAIRLDDGTELPEVEQAFTLHGEIDEKGSNLVVVLHALTGDPHVQRWWPEVVGPGRALDTDRWAVVCPSLIGSPYGTTRPPPGARVTPRDMARLTIRLAEALGAPRPALVTGGSLGGMVALEWVAADPDSTEAAVVFAAPGAQPSSAIGAGHVQRRALELGGRDGLALARMAAMLTYRTDRELEHRFGRQRRTDGRFEMQSWLEHHGRSFVDRFDVESYTLLLDAMDAHDVAGGRGSFADALGHFGGLLVGVGVPGDVLYPAQSVRDWTEPAGAEYEEIHSIHGHDAFLLETDQVARILHGTLARVDASSGALERQREGVS